MKAARTKRIAAGLLTLVLTLSLLPAAAAEETGWAADIPAMLAAGPYAEGEVIAAVDPACADDFDLLVLMGLKDDLEGEDLMPVPEEEASAGEAVLTLISRPGRTTEELLYALAGDDRVVFAEPNYVQEAPEPVNEEALTAALQAAAATRSPAGTASLQEKDADRWDGVLPHEEMPDLTPLQWGHQAVHVPNFGTTEGNMTGDPIVVALIDTPVDFSHPDLAPAAFTFTEEQQELLGCDVHGYNATWQSKDGKLDLEGASNHGTHCAGVVGAAWDGHGISGAASNVRLIGVQISTYGLTSLVDSLRGYDFIRRANELGADIRIASNSWGLFQSSLALDAAVRALGEEQRVVSVFAAGNDARDQQDLEQITASLANNPYAILVAASAPSEELVWFSNYGGSFVDLAAPGEQIFSAVLPEDSQYVPDFTREADSFYEGFEGDAPPGHGRPGGR